MTSKRRVFLCKVLAGKAVDFGIVSSEDLKGGGGRSTAQFHVCFHSHEYKPSISGSPVATVCDATDMRRATALAEIKKF